MEQLVALKGSGGHKLSMISNTFLGQTLFDIVGKISPVLHSKDYGVFL